jgi:hypothetical protein
MGTVFFDIFDDWKYCEKRMWLVTANVVPSFMILFALMKYVPMKRRFLQEPHDVTSQKTAFFIFIDVQTSDLSSVKRHVSF